MAGIEEDVKGFFFRGGADLCTWKMHEFIEIMKIAYWLELTAELVCLLVVVLRTIPDYTQNRIPEYLKNKLGKLVALSASGHLNDPYFLSKMPNDFFLVHIIWWNAHFLTSYFENHC